MGHIHQLAVICFSAPASDTEKNNNFFTFFKCSRILINHDNSFGFNLLIALV